MSKQFLAKCQKSKTTLSVSAQLSHGARCLLFALNFYISSWYIYEQRTLQIVWLTWTFGCRLYDYCRANQEWQWRNILFTIVK